MCEGNGQCCDIVDAEGALYAEAGDFWVTAPEEDILPAFRRASALRRAERSTRHRGGSKLSVMAVQGGDARHIPLPGPGSYRVDLYSLRGRHLQVLYHRSSSATVPAPNTIATGPCIVRVEAMNR